MKLKFLLLGLFVILGLFLTGHVQAMTESSSILATIVPENPAPNQNFSITLESFSEDLDTPIITWFVNGKNVLSGVAKKSISLTAPSAGSEMYVVAQMIFSDTETQVSTFIRPAELIMLWEGVDSYVPPFYKGKALPSPDTFVKVVAMPEIITKGVLVSPKNMIFSWQRDFSNIEGTNGYGKNSFVFRNDYLENSNNISVIANTIDTKFFSESRIDIAMYTPKLSFYRIDESLGTIWDMAIKNDYFIKTSDILLAAPYFISPKDIRRPDLLFRWSINKIPIDVPNYQKLSIPLMVEEGTSGTAKVRLEIESTDKIFQTAEKTINVEF